MSHLSDLELTMLDLSDLPRDTPFLICGVSHTQLSIARHYGGCKFSGKNYSYVQETDELIRDDVAKWLAKIRKKAKAEAKKSCDTAVQGDMLLPANDQAKGPGGFSPGPA